MKDSYIANPIKGESPVPILANTQKQEKYFCACYLQLSPHNPVHTTGSISPGSTSTKYKFLISQLIVTFGLYILLDLA